MPNWIASCTRLRGSGLLLLLHLAVLDVSLPAVPTPHLHSTGVAVVELIVVVVVDRNGVTLENVLSSERAVALIALPRELVLVCVDSMICQLVWLIEGSLANVAHVLLDGVHVLHVLDQRRLAFEALVAHVALDPALKTMRRHLGDARERLLASAARSGLSDARRCRGRRRCHGLRVCVCESVARFI